MSRVVVVLLLLLSTLLRGEENSSSSSSPPRGYGDPCTCDRDCDLNQWLTCQEGRCLCLAPSLKFDHHRTSCVVRLGQKCFEVVGGQYPNRPPFIRCVEGAFCSISVGGLCACNTYGYYESQDGTRCEPRKEFGSKCENPLECKTDACSLEDGCTCREGQYYDFEREKCLGLVGAFCFMDTECTLNAICNDVEAKCVCGPGFSSSTPGQPCAPQLRLGDPCGGSLTTNSTTAATNCNNPSLSCIQNRCECRYPNHQIVDTTTASCLSMVRSAPCSSDALCVSGAKCVQDAATGFSECRCSPGHLEVGDGSCQPFKTWGDVCTSAEECDPITPLVCKDGHCDCPDSLATFDSERRTCRGLHGFRGCANDESCTQFATCVQSNAKLPAKCFCQTPSYKPNRDRTCVPA